MDWAESIQNAISYIEQHLTDELDYAQIASCAGTSAFYFQKIFGIMCGMTLGEYIRNRRLTLAGSELIGTDVRVIDLALKYGYESPESFTRAFTRFHGATPTEVRREGGSLRSFYPVKVQIILKGGNDMYHKVVEKESFTVLEKVEQHTVSGEQNKNTIPEFWDRAHKDGTVETLLKHASDRSFIFGICYGSGHTDCEHFDYGIAVACAADTVAPEGFRVTTIPARSWVVAECTGPVPEAIQQLWHSLCSEFFPTSHYELTYEMDIEAFPAWDMTSPNYKSQIWIPIKKQ